MPGTCSLHAHLPLLAHCPEGLYLHCSLGPRCGALALAWVFLGGTFAQYPALHWCMAHDYCPKPLPGTVPAHCWVVCTLVGLRTQSPCTEFTVPHGTVTALHVCATFYPCPRVCAYSAPWDCVELVFWTGFPRPAVPSALYHMLFFLYFRAVLHGYTGHFISVRIHGASAIPGPVLVSGGGEELGRLELSAWVSPPPAMT